MTKKHLTNHAIRFIAIILCCVFVLSIPAIAAPAQEVEEPTYYVAVYTTTTAYYTSGITATGSRIAQETESVYFALSTDGVNYEVVNWGGGVIFAPASLSSYGANSPAAVADPNNLTNAALNNNSANAARIRNPLIFYDAAKWADQPFRVVASDMAANVGFYEFSSADGVYFRDVKRIPLRANVEAIYDLDTPRLSKSDITLMFNGRDLIITDPNITLGNAIEITAEQYQLYLDKLTPIYNTGLEAVQEYKLLEGQAITVETIQDDIPAVTATYSDGSSKPFKVDWTGALDGIDLSIPGVYEVTGEVIQTRYLNRLKELNGSNLPEDDPENTNPDFPAHVDPATRTVFYDETKFVEGLADPQIWWDEPTGYYYMTGSYFPQLGIDEMPDEVLHGSNSQYDRIAIRRSKTLAGLQRRIPPTDVMDPDAIGQVTVWKTGNQRYFNNPLDRQNNPVGRMGYRFIWAPQIHRLAYEGPCVDIETCDAAFYANGGTTPCSMGWWVVYFTQSQSATDRYNIFSHIIVLPGHRDPYESALKTSAQVSEWINYRVLHPEFTTNTGAIRTVAQAQAVNSRLYGSLITAFNLDLDYFKNEVTGASYLSWTGKPMYLGNGNTDIFIAGMDEKIPWEINTPETRLTFPDFGWERISYQVNEGTTTIQRDGKIYLAFSGAGTGSEYAIGFVVADADADLLAYADGTTAANGRNGRPANWVKSPFPVLSSRHVDGEEGPGHNSFAKDEDGNDIFVYHARPTSHNFGLCGGAGNPLGDPCRHARIKRVHWAADGTPIINMTYDNELRPENRTVSTTITIAPFVDAKTDARSFISIQETSKNSRIWILSFTVTEYYDDGSNIVVPYEVSINANNANVDGRIDLGRYTLIYDIKGNASNIKDFRVVLN